jgi:Acidic N-terminal SPT6
MSSDPAGLEHREGQQEHNMLVDAGEDEPNDALSADSSEEPEEDEDEARRIREGFIVDEDEDEEDEEVPDERRKRKKRKRHHHRRGSFDSLLSERKPDVRHLA